MINAIWLVLISSGIIYSIFNGNIEIINNEIIASVTSGIQLILSLMPVIVLWMGIMRLAKNSGLLDKFASLIKPFLCKLFPSLRKDDPALSYIASNIAANMLGLGSAATPFGLKAMEELDKNNPNRGVATDAMITFLVLNTAGVTIIPTTVIAIRMSYNSIDPTRIILPAILATFISSLCGLSLDYIIRRKNR